jgi:aminopeptidase N
MPETKRSPPTPAFASANCLLRTLPVLLFLLPCIRLQAQTYNPVIDILHYDFSISVNDSNDRICGQAVIALEFRENASSFSLDLTGRNKNGKGMTVSSVKEGGKTITFSQDSNRLILHAPGSIGSNHTYTIGYSGIPADGLIIANNKFGSRGFFGDNWPNRAHNWLPCVDDPSDKATLEFRIIAPDHYVVVANGKKVEDRLLWGHRKLTHWRETEPLAPKIMVIGIADFAIDHPGDAMGVPVWNYVYKQNKGSGFQSYSVALQILPFYITHIGPYPFEKEGNVQSKTRYGGLENASAIFYYEGSVGSPGIESLMAHEIAHQWFGDAVTETKWQHLWLSEGFATYMTLCYLENKYGADTLKHSLQNDRRNVISLEKMKFTPVIDTTVKNDYMQLLNPNSYEKGSWVLHMLRRGLGDTLFWKGISAYYAAYRNKNASSADFEKVMESVSGRDLHTFFHQWLDVPGHPHLTITWKFDADKKALLIDITQKGPILFQFPLEFSTDGVLHQAEIRDASTHLEIPFPEKPVTLTPDPNTNLLADFEVISQ